MRKLLTAVTLAWALWTGRMEYITTVTYQQGVNCQYDYMGQKFWRAFTSMSCPQHVWVE